MSSIAVVMITKDRPSELEASLGHLRALPDRPRLIVVDNGSSSSLAGIRRSFPEVGLVPLPANFGAAARTVGVRVAGTDYVAFADDDSWWDHGALDRATELLDADPLAGVVAARVLVGPAATEDPTSAAMSSSPIGADLRPWAGGRRGVVGFLACGSVVRSRAYLSVGGFAAPLGVGGEEQLLAWDLLAAGWRLIYAPEIVARHHPSPRRDPIARRRAELRNELWVSWARRPFTSAVRRTASLAVRAGRHPGRLPALLAAAAHPGWSLAHRARLPDPVEAALRLVEAHEGGRGP